MLDANDMKTRYIIIKSAFARYVTVLAIAVTRTEC